MILLILWKLENKIGGPRFPTERSARAWAGPAGAGAEEETMGQWCGEPTVHVLLVEDEALIAMTTAQALADHGFEVDVAASGEAALRRLAGGDPVDILVTDIHLGEGIGGEAVARLARQLRPGLPVVYASGAARGVEQPVPGSAFLAKPYELSRLRETLSRMTSATPVDPGRRGGAVVGCQASALPLAG
jgi:CheY-like chemotaxis protein